jgi:hypothetical protein
MKANEGQARGATTVADPSSKAQGIGANSLTAGLPLLRLFSAENAWTLILEEGRCAACWLGVLFVFR